MRPGIVGIDFSKAQSTVTASFTSAVSWLNDHAGVIGDEVILPIRARLRHDLSLVLRLDLDADVSEIRGLDGLWLVEAKVRLGKPRAVSACTRACLTGADSLQCPMLQEQVGKLPPTHHGAKHR